MRQAEARRDDERNGDGAGVHHQHVLDAEGDEPSGARNLVHGMLGNGRNFCFFARRLPHAGHLQAVLTQSRPRALAWGLAP
ncbi:hypothetical protein GCM10009678_13550 [Actinomadura kijaniata]